MHRVRVTDYLNFREYLKDLFEWLRKSDSSFSQKRILMELGATSSGFLSNVLAGRKNLSSSQSAKLAKLLTLDKMELGYFQTLVMFTQSRKMEEKNDLFSRLTAMQSAQVKQMHEQALTLFSKWYYVAIREVLHLIEWRGDMALLAKSLQPEIRVSEAQEAVEALLKLGLIREKPNGCITPCDPAISTAEELSSRHLSHFQISTLDLAKQALHMIPTEERDISVLSIGLSPENFHLVKNEIRLFRKRLSKISMDDSKASRVFQVNFQLFPISQPLVSHGIKHD